MFNGILLLLLAPFLPVWMQATFDANHNQADEKSAQHLQEERESEKRFGGNEDKKYVENESGINLNKSSLFPIDTAFASGYVPNRKKNYADLKIWAGSSVAIDVDSGTILHYSNGRKRTQIASLTKLMTAILAVEHIENMDEEITLSRECLNVPGTIVGCPTSVFCNANRMYAGEKVRAGDLLKAMLMNSANDAANALGAHIAGSVEKFVEIMNEKAKKMGLKDTNFCTPSGLEIDGKEDQCYSSAYDIARIAAFSLRYDIIWEIMRIPEGRFYSTDGKYMHELKNTDILLENMPNCIGGKTGFTPMAGKSLLLGATDENNEHEIIAVLLNDEDRWEDMRTLVDWVFRSYEWK